MRTFFYVAIGTAVVGSIYLLWLLFSKPPQVALNASGYTYPSSPGA